MEMFGQAEKQQSLIIVHSDDTVAYANYLMMLIASNDDEGNTIVGVKDGSIKTMVWSIKQYLDNKPQLSSDQHTLFIGQDKKFPKSATEWNRSSASMECHTDGWESVPI